MMMMMMMIIIIIIIISIIMIIIVIIINIIILLNGIIRDSLAVSNVIYSYGFILFFVRQSSQTRNFQSNSLRKLRPQVRV